MGAVTLRATEERDLPRISELTEAVFGIRRDVPLLRWLLNLRAGRQASPGRIESWIAESGGEVVGHAAALSHRYRVADRTETGVHPYLWMVLPEERGRAGMKLGRLIGSRGDFQIVLGGTPTTKAILSKRRFAAVAEAREYHVLRWPETAADDLELVPSRRADSAPLPAGLIVNEAAREHLEWLARCPDLEAHRFALERGGEHVGPVLVFVNRRVTPVAGRLVHLPYLGDRQDAWRAALAGIDRELARLGCASWTLLATHPALIEACETAGADIAGRRPVWIRERGEVPGGRAGRLWHLTYLEGDLAYRRVEPPVTRSKQA